MTTSKPLLSLIPVSFRSQSCRAKNHRAVLASSKAFMFADLLQRPIITPTTRLVSLRRFTNNDGSNIPVAQVLYSQSSTQEHERLERILREAVDRYESATRGDEASLEREALLQLRNAYQDLEYWDEALKVEELWMVKFCETDLDRAAALYRQGKLHMRLQETVKAGQLYQKALDLYRQEYGETYCCPEIGNVLISMAGIQYHRGHYQESLNLLTSAEVHFYYYIDEELEYHPDFVKCLQHQGLLHRTIEDYSRALETYQRALELYEQICHKHEKMHKHPPLCSEETKHKRQGLKMDIADMLAALDRTKEALDLYETILKEDEEHRQLRHLEQPNVALQGILSHSMGKLRAQLGDHEAALLALTRAIDLKSAVLGDSHPEMAKTWNALGAVHAVLHDRRRALDCFQQSLLISRMHHHEDDPQVMFALRNIAVLKGEQVPKWGTKEDKNR